MASYQFNPINILNTSNAIGNGSGGSLTVGGGISIGRDTYIGGKLDVSGTSASFADNIIIINKNPVGSVDTGLLFGRYSSDISNSQNYSGIIYSEQNDKFLFGYTESDPEQNNISLSSLIPIVAGGALFTAGSLNASYDCNTVGNIYTTGGNVGIGKGDPEYTLDINGGIRYNSIMLGTDLSITNATVSNLISLNGNLTNGTISSLVSADGSITNINAISITASNANLSGALTTGSLFITNQSIDFTGGSSTQVNINIQDGQALRFGSNSLNKPHFLVVGNNFTNGGRVTARYTRFFSAEYTNGTTSTINMLVGSTGNIGIGTSSPSYKIHLSADSAAKPSTNTWTISSDFRLKTNITLANLDTCYNNIKNIPLKRYTWLDNIYTNEEVSDRSKLGWIAQDVEVYFPKAVEQKDMFGYTDCRTLNSDQIIASLYGAVQKLISKVEAVESKLNV